MKITLVMRRLPPCLRVVKAAPYKFFQQIGSQKHIRQHHLTKRSSHLANHKMKHGLATSYLPQCRVKFAPCQFSHQQIRSQKRNRQQRPTKQSPLLARHDIKLVLTTLLLLSMASLPQAAAVFGCFCACACSFWLRL